MLIEHGIEPLPATFFCVGIDIASCYSMEYLRRIHNDVMRKNARARESRKYARAFMCWQTGGGEREREGELELVPFRLTLSVCVLSLVRSTPLV